MQPCHDDSSKVHLPNNLGTGEFHNHDYDHKSNDTESIKNFPSNDTLSERNIPEGSTQDFLHYRIRHVS